MNHKWKRSLTVLLLIALVLSLPCATAFASDEGGGDTGASGEYVYVDPFLEPGSNKLIVNLDANQAFEEDASDMLNASVQVDLYLLATAEKVDGYDTYELVLDETKYSDLKTDFDTAMTAEDPDFYALAEKFAAEILDTSGSEPAATASQAQAAEGDTTITFEGLDAGMYLVVPRGSDLAWPDYVSEMDVGGETRILTLANSALYEYRFLPQLISLPTKDEAYADGETEYWVTDEEKTFPFPGYHTGYGYGNWTDTLTITLKADREFRLGDLWITKTLKGWLEGSKGVSVVFHVVATVGTGENKKTVYDDIVQLNFDAEGSKTAKLIEKFPVGAEVTITEVYPGAGYKPVSSDNPDADGIVIKTGVIPPPYASAAEREADPNRENADAYKESFTNEFKGGGGGYGYLNTYTNDGEAGSATEYTNANDSAGPSPW